MLPQIVRLAPSPTGMMHLGTVRTGYYNYLMAKATGGKFILRIDDTDIERNKQEYTQLILDTLDWLGLEYDEIYYQSQRLEIYSKVARSLLEEGKVIEADNGAIILKPAAIQLPESFIDTIAGEIKITETNRQQIDGTNGYLVLTRGATKIEPRCTHGHDRCYDAGQKNCPYCENWDTTKLHQPTYQFCSVVDDYYMGITNIIRGGDHISNTPKQIAIWNIMDYVDVHNYEPYLATFPKFTHLGLIFKDGKKLSKREGAASLLWYKDQGYKPEAILFWLLKIGWSMQVPRGASKEEQRAANRYLSKDEAIDVFLKGTMKSSPCNYEIAKLDNINKRL